MSELLWNRKAAVTFGQENLPGTLVQRLRIAFKIVKTRETNPNPATIKIYNLNPSNRSVLEDTQNLVVFLSVGYGNVLEQIFSGNITLAGTEKVGPDYITTIEGGDGQKAITKGRLDKSYLAGTPYSTIAQDAISAMKDAGSIALGAFSNVTSSEKTQNGMTVSGQASKVLSNAAEKLGLEWSIQDNEVQILSPNQSNSEEAVLLTPTSGLIDKVIKKDEGINFKSLLNTKLIPGGLADIRSNSYTGIVRINRAEFDGDTHGPNWYAVCQGEAV